MSPNQKRILIFAGVIGAVVLVLLAVYFLTRKTSGPSNTAGNTLQITTPAGSVSVKDFTQKPVEQVTDTMAIAETADYNIIYFTKEQQFQITLLSQPISHAQQLAESALLQDLNISQPDACKLSVKVTVPYSVDPNIAGTTSGLSFCQ